MTIDDRSAGTGPAPQIHIHHAAADAGAHIWRVLATFLAIGGMVSLAYGLAQWGLIDIAATGVTAFLTMLVQLMLRNGVIVLPSAPSDDQRITEGVGALRAIAGLVQAILDRSSLLRLTLIAAGYAVTFVLVRTLIGYALTVFGNVWIALAAGGIIASLICFPTLIAGLLSALRSQTRREA